MRKDTFQYETIITAERGKFLKILGLENSEELIGKPERIIFSNKGVIPECEEKDLESAIEPEEQLVEEKQTKKKTTKKTTKSK